MLLVCHMKGIRNVKILAQQSYGLLLMTVQTGETAKIGWLNELFVIQLLLLPLLYRQHRSDGDLGCARVIWSGPPVSPVAKRHQ